MSRCSQLMSSPFLCHVPVKSKLRSLLKWHLGCLVNHLDVFEVGTVFYTSAFNLSVVNSWHLWALTQLSLKLEKYFEESCFPDFSFQWLCISVL